MRKHILLPLLLLFLAMGPVRAQFYIGVHGGVTLPKGYYAGSKLSDHEWMFLEESSQKFVGAGTGWFGGLDLAFPMPFHQNLAAVVTADFMQSGFNKDVRAFVDNRIETNSAIHEKYDLSVPRLRNIPILAGLRYSYPIGVYYDLYGEALAGVNMRQITEWRELATDPAISCETTYQYDPVKTFAFRIGAGVVVRDMITIGASYTMLGNSRLLWDKTETYIYPDHTVPTSSRRDSPNYSFNPSMVMITLGFRINPFQSLVTNVQDN